MHGGLKIYRGAASAARSYVEADRSRADDYYLTEGTGLAEYFAASRDPDGLARVRHLGSLSGDDYERWVAGHDLATGDPKGRLRTDAQGVRFVEVVVNGPKTWSIAAAVHPEVAVAYDAAQQRAAGEIIGWLAQHAATRIGSRGCQVQVPVTEIEAAMVRHYTSRAGDPHRHLHLQINARVLAAGRWRGIHTVGVRDSLEAINGIGHAAVMCDPGFRAALAAHGYTLDADGEVTQLEPYVGAFSARAGQIRTNVDRYEAQWRADHPREEPGPALRQAWDRRAWAEARPDKVVPVDASRILASWTEELGDLGFRAPNRPAGLEVARVGGLDRDAIAETVISRLGSRRSAWNAADIRGEVEQQIAAAGVVTSAQVRGELAEDLTARLTRTSPRLVDRDDVPEHVRTLTSPRVVAVEKDLTSRLTRRGQYPVIRVEVPPSYALDETQHEVVAALVGSSALLVVEGAAGAGKTRTLAEAHTYLWAQGRQLVVVTPTLKAAQVATSELGTAAHSAASLIHTYGFSWDQDGRWTRQSHAQPTIPLGPGDVLLVDEAGMLDQDVALALLTIADETGASLALVGDRHQLPAVGRGGVLDIAAACAHPQGRLALDTVHRFADPEYANLTLQMRTGDHPEEVFDALLARGEIRIHATEVERLHALSAAPGLLIADSSEQVALLNAAAREHRILQRHANSEGLEVSTTAGERISVGDLVVTRLNDHNLDVANRETWTVTNVRPTGALEVHGDRGHRTLPAGYVAQHVQLAYATTVHGAQGQTVDTAHLLVGDSTGAASAYVGMTRGRHSNHAHLVADSVEAARAQWTAMFARDRADLGPTNAQSRAWEDIQRFGLQQAYTQGVETGGAPQEITYHPTAPSPPGGPSR
jgi:conjugative relaxase-like TrwC/TraI family protein